MPTCKCREDQQSDIPVCQLQAASGLLVACNVYQTATHSATLDSHALAMQCALNLGGTSCYCTLLVAAQSDQQQYEQAQSSCSNWEFLFDVTQVTVDMLLECPITLMASPGKHMGPRFSFLLSFVAQDDITMDSHTGLFCFMAKNSNVLFDKLNRLHLGLLYDRAFQDRWVGT